VGHRLDSHGLERAKGATSNSSQAVAAFWCALLFGLEAPGTSLRAEQPARPAQTAFPGVLAASERGTRWCREPALQQLPRLFFPSAGKKTEIRSICVRLPRNGADLSSPDSSVFLSMARAALCRSNNKLLQC